MEHYDKTLERINTVLELSKDCINIKRCEDNLHFYNRGACWSCLLDMIREYALQLEFFGFCVDGVHLTKGTELCSLSDDELKMQVGYILKHIPVYVLLKEGEKELARNIYEKLNNL